MYDTIICTVTSFCIVQYKVILQRIFIEQMYTNVLIYFLSFSNQQIERLVLKDCHWVSGSAVEYHALSQVPIRSKDLFNY